MALFNPDDYKSEDEQIYIKGTVENGSITNILLFGNTEDYGTDGVSIKLNRNKIYLRVNYECGDIGGEWEMDRDDFIRFLQSVEGN